MRPESNPEFKDSRKKCCPELYSYIENPTFSSEKGVYCLHIKDVAKPLRALEEEIIQALDKAEQDYLLKYEDRTQRKCFRQRKRFRKRADFIVKQGYHPVGDQTGQRPGPI